MCYALNIGAIVKQSERPSDLVASFTHAIRGFFYAVQKERNLQIHLAIAFCVAMGGIFLQLPLTDFLLIILMIVIVLVAEFMNTVVEMLVDVMEKKYDIRARRVKDVSAAMVLVASFCSVVVGYLVLSRHFPPSFRDAFGNIADSPWYFTFFAFLIIFFLYLAIKALVKGRALITGGMPSIHSGIAFSIWTIISFLTFRQEPFISLLVFLLAFWVAQSRVVKRIHTLGEVLIGAVAGIFITILVFQILSAVRMAP